MVLALAAAWPLAATPALAGWQEDIGTFRIGLVAEPGAGSSIAGLSTLTDAYTKALGMKVEFFVARDYPALIDAQAAGRIEYALFSAVAYAATELRCGCVEPLAAPIGDDGSTGIRAVLIARDGRLSTTADMAGKRIVIGPPDSVTGNQLPLAAFQPAGTPLSGDEAFLVRAETQGAAEAMFLAGEADAMFGWVPAIPGSAPPSGGTLARLEAAGLAAGSLSVVWRSDILRYGPHAVLAKLDPEAKRRLGAFLSNLRSFDRDVYDLIERHHQGGFVPVGTADYAPAVAIAKRLAGAAAR